MTTVVLNTATRKVEVFSSARDVQARAEIADHKAAADPHPQYLADADLADVALSGDAGDLTAGTVPDARMPNWTGYNVASRTALEATNVPAVVDALRLLGYTSIGDGGGALYKRAASEPSHDGKIQSAGGAWWEIAERRIFVEMLGAVGDGTTDDRAAIQRAIDTVQAFAGGEVLFREKTYAIASTHPTFIGQSPTSPGIIIRPGVYLRGAGRGATTIKRTAAIAMHMVDFAGAIAGSGIADLTIDGNWPTLSSGGHGIQCENGATGVVADMDIMRVEVKNQFSYGISTGNGSIQRARFIDIYIENVGADGIDIKNQNHDNQGLYFDRIFVKEHGLRSGLVSQAALDVRGECTLSNIFCVYTTAGTANKYGIRMRQGTESDGSGRGAWHSSLVNFVVKSTGAQTSGRGLSVENRFIQVANGYISGSWDGVVVTSESPDSVVSNVNVENVINDGFRAGGLAHRASFHGCNVQNAGGFGFLLEGLQQRIIGGSASGVTPGVRVGNNAVDAVLIGLNLTGVTTPVHNTGANTRDVLCIGSNLSARWDFGGNARIGTYSTFDDPGAAVPSMHIGENIAGSSVTPNGELILGHVSSSVTDDILGQLSFYSSDESGSAKGRQAAIKAITTNPTGVFAALAFFTGTGAENSTVERMRINGVGSVGIGETSPAYKLDVNGSFGFTPGGSVTPADNGDVVFEFTNNTTLTVKAKGTDGTVRSGAISLA